jgi:hypothetical protein
MAEDYDRSSRRIVLLGMAIGWIVGILWWVGLTIVLGPSVEVSNRTDGQPGFQERPISVASRAIWAPLVAIPWGVVGLIVGGFNAHYRGYFIPVIAILGTLIGFGWSTATSYFDGHLAMTMPVACLGGTLGALVVAVPIRAVCGWIRGWEG